MSNKKHPTTSVMYPNGIPAGRAEPRRSRNSKSTLIPSCIKILSPGRTDYENKKASSALLLLWRTCSQRKHKGTTPSSLGYISCYITSRKERKKTDHSLYPDRSMAEKRSFHNLQPQKTNHIHPSHVFRRLAFKPGKRPPLDSAGPSGLLYGQPWTDL